MAHGALPHAQPPGPRRRPARRRRRLAPGFVVGRVVGAFGRDDVHHRVDQRQMGERLREVAQVAAGAWSISSAYSASGLANDSSFSHSSRARPVLADLDERGDQPEGADRERALLAAEAVVGLVGR